MIRSQSTIGIVPAAAVGDALLPQGALETGFGVQSSVGASSLL
ncbi:hypothetical protein SALB1_0284 [Salinisphaera sp. LB1]|nr:hypothetical protein SALB1_0284 [Salinisphaera sp. LB1]